MKEVLKRVALRNILLVTLLACGLTFYGLVLNVGEPSPDETLFSFDSPSKLPAPDNENHPTPLPIRQLTPINLICPQGVAGISSQTGRTKNTNSVWSILHFCQHNVGTEFKKTLFYIVNIPNTIFKMVSGHVYQYLDLPPPHA